MMKEYIYPYAQRTRHNNLNAAKQTDNVLGLLMCTLRFYLKHAKEVSVYVYICVIFSTTM